MKFTKSFETTAIKGSTQENEPYFNSFGIHPATCSLYGEKPENIIKVRCTVSEDQTEHTPPDYWGWFDNKTGWTYGGLLWPSFTQLKMCFIYGYEAEEKAGKAYRLDVEEL